MMIPVLQNNLPAWAVMWIMAFSIYAFCKILSWWQVKSTLLSPNKYKSLIYLFLWPGMDASSFIFKPTNHLQPALKDWMSASIKLIIGILLFFGAAWTFPVNHPMIKGWIGMIGLVMLLHFGIFHLLALTWQKLGMNAECLFYKPILSTSVGDFWGGRWNKAFRDLTHKFIYNPLRPRIGVAGSIFVGFLISGLVHELVISVPAKGGYGLPTMYFLIQAVDQRSR